MDKTLTDILGSTALPTELVEEMQQAFESKIAAARQELEESIRAELSQRYEHDKNHLVEAMDQAMTAVVEAFQKEKAGELATLREATERMEQTLVEGKARYKNAIREHVAKANDLIATKLAEAIKSSNAERVALAEERVRVANEVEDLKVKISEAHNAHVDKIDAFITKQVTRELNEFQIDKRALVETRMKLVAENRKQLKEAQDRFVKQAARSLDKHISEQLSRELSQIHEDIERNRQNHFGSKIFEAFFAEFMTSQYSDSTAAKQLQQVLESREEELAKAKAALTEAQTEASKAVQKARLAEDRSQRAAVMAELLAPLRGEKKAVMESMLDGVPTKNLRSSYDQLLSMVSDNVGGKKRATPAKVLSESKAPEALVTGDQRQNRLIEEAKTSEISENDSIAQVVRLAGIKH